MTLADQLREEGRLEGLLEGERKGMLEGERKGMHRIADHFLATGAELSFVAKITGLPINELHNQKDKSK